MSRLVVLSVPTGKSDTVRSVLDDIGIDYTETEASGSREYEALFLFPLPTAGVEPVLGDLSDAGVKEDASTIVLDTATVLSHDLDELKEQFSEEEETSEERIAAQELETAVEGLLPTTGIFTVMMVVSAFIAAGGLLLDSAAVVVGSMVIAPFIGPAMASNVGTVLNDRDLFLRGVKLQLLGVGLAVGSATVFALSVRLLNLIPPGLELLASDQITERTSPDFISLVIALGAGIAGVTSLTTGLSSAIVGVMIAVALIPPAATIGLGIAWGSTQVAVGSGVLLMVNVLSINLAALGVLWYMGYRPEHWYWVEQSREDLLKQAAVLIVSLAVLSVFLGGVTLSSYQAANTEEAVRGDVMAVLDQTQYEELSLVDIDITYEQGIVFEHPRRVTITIGHPPGVEQGPIGSALAVALEDTVESDVVINVRYVTVERL